MTRTLQILAAAVLCVFPGIAGSAKNDFDPDFDFGRLKTFAFIGGHNLGGSDWLDEPEMRQRFGNFISGALEMRGLTEVPRDSNPNLVVRFWVGRRQKQDVSVISYGAPSMWGGYPPYWTGYWGYSYEEYVVQNYEQGTVVVDLIDPGSKELVWRTVLKQKIEDRAKAYVEAKENLYKAMAALPPSPAEKEKMRSEREKLAAKYK